MLLRRNASMPIVHTSHLMLAHTHHAVAAGTGYSVTVVLSTLCPTAISFLLVELSGFVVNARSPHHCTRLALCKAILQQPCACSSWPAVDALSMGLQGQAFRHSCRTSACCCCCGWRCYRLVQAVLVNVGECNNSKRLRLQPV